MVTTARRIVVRRRSDRSAVRPTARARRVRRRCSSRVVARRAGVLLRRGPARPAVAPAEVRPCRVPPRRPGRRWPAAGRAAAGPARRGATRPSSVAAGTGGSGRGVAGGRVLSRPPRPCAASRYAPALPAAASAASAATVASRRGGRPGARRPAPVRISRHRFIGSRSSGLMVAAHRGPCRTARRTLRPLGTLCATGYRVVHGTLSDDESVTAAPAAWINLPDVSEMLDVKSARCTR